MKQTAPFSIIHEDDLIIAVNKTSGLTVGGDRWDESKERLDMLLNELLTERMGKQSVPSDISPADNSFCRVWTIHRIDRDTSGLVVFAKDEQTHKRLSSAFESRKVQKRYIAVVHGHVSWTETSCDLPLVPNGDKQHRTIIDKYHGKKSLTRFRLRCNAGNYSVVEALPETGRTHQIRVHLASLGHPIVCDPLYGKSAGRSIEKGIFLSSFKKGWRGDPLREQPLLNRLGLHAASLVLPDFHADSAQPPELSLEAPLPRDMASLINQMEKCGRPLSTDDSVTEDEQ
jgi:23S rRNA pseudouridine1911/1915/1917 synthase